MTKTHENGRLEIWTEVYINNEEIRLDRDRDVEIVQIEKGHGTEYIVEIVEREEK